MALSDKTQFDDRIAATFSTIPSKYPPLPNDVLTRFPSLESWQKDQSSLIARVKEALDSMGSDFGIPLNKAQVAQELLSKTVATQYDELSARITTENTILVDENQALAQRTTTIESTINTPATGLLARINVVETTYATKDYATAKKEEAITAAVTSANSYTVGQISSLASVYATPAFVETKKTETLSAAATAANTYTNGQISSLSLVYATPSQVTSTVNNIISASVGSTSGTIGAAIETERQARATSDGNLSGKYTLKVTAGNVVTGMNITSSTGSGSDVSSVTFLASEFKIYNSATGIAPFSVIGGVIYAQNMVIDGNLVVSGSIAASRLNFIPVTSTNVVASINATAEGIQISGSKIQISGSTTFSSGYDPTSKITAGSAAADINAYTTTINGGKITANTLDINRLNFVPVQTTNVVASINATAEGIQISGSRIQISGSTTFSSGYDPTSKITAGSAASDVNANTTTINGGKITATSITAAQIDVATLSLTSSQIGGTAVTLSAIGSGLTITSGGVILSGTSAIRSSNYVAGSAGWAIKADGSVEFSSGTFRGTVNIGSGYAQTQIDASGLRIGSFEFNASGITSVLKTTPTYNSNRGMILSSGAYDSYIKIGYNLESNIESVGFYATTEQVTIRKLFVYDGLNVTGGNLSVTNAATINGNTYSGSFSSNGNGSFNSLNISASASVDSLNVSSSASINGAGFSNSTFNLHPGSSNDMTGGEDGGTAGAVTGAYISIKYNGRQVWIPFFTALP